MKRPFNTQLSGRCALLTLASGADADRASGAVAATGLIAAALLVVGVSVLGSLHSAGITIPAQSAANAN
jgi:hypothetical protein